MSLYEARQEAERVAEQDRVDAERQAVVDAEKQAVVDAERAAERDLVRRRDSANGNAVRETVAAARVKANEDVAHAQSAWDVAVGDVDATHDDLFTKWVALRESTEVAAVMSEFGDPERAAQRRLYEPTGISGTSFASAVELAITRRVESVARTAQSTLGESVSRAGNDAAAKVKAVTK